MKQLKSFLFCFFSTIVLCAYADTAEAKDKEPKPLSADEKVEVLALAFATQGEQIQLAQLDQQYQQLRAQRVSAIQMALAAEENAVKELVSKYKATGYRIDPKTQKWVKIETPPPPAK